MKKVIFLFSSIIFVVLLSAFYFQDDPWEIPDKYMAMENPTSASDDECMDIGKSLYGKHCESCHGKEGFGDGKKASEIDTPMPDITTGDYKNQKAGVIYYKSFIGRKDMPNFEKKIPDEEDRWCLINYMHNL